MTKIDPRILKILKYQNRAMIANTIIAIWAGIYFGVGSSENNIIAGLIGLLISWSLMKFLNWAALLFFQFKIYGHDAPQLAEDARVLLEANNQVERRGPIPFMLKITNHSAPCGKFMDAIIHEWIEIQGEDGEMQRLVFAGTMNLSNGVPQQIPDNCLLIPPGLLYQVEASINTPT